MKVLVSFFLLLTLSSSALQAENERPNILLLSVDDLNDWIGVLDGHPQAITPNMDWLASQGTLFSNAHCQSPVCQPSRASLMTSRYPHTTGLYFLNPDLKESPVLEGVPTLPEWFAQKGYTTMSVGKLFHGGEERFFQEHGGRFGGFGPVKKAEEKLSYPIGHPLWDWGAFPETDEEMPDYKIAEWAVNKLNGELKEPFLLGVGMFRPHVPLYAPKKWFDRYPIEKVLLPEVKENDLDDISQYAEDLVELEHVAPSHEWMEENGQWKHAVQSYLASITFADHYVGEVLNALKKSQYYDNTIIVLFSDHGFHMGEKRHWAKRTVWEDGTRVPLMVAGPGLPKNQVSNQPVELLDIFPTIVELSGYKKDPSHQGVSLRPWLENPDKKKSRPAITSFGPGNYGIKTERWRYIRYMDGSEEIYDHKNDPGEWKNLVGTERGETMIKNLRKWIPKDEHEVLGENSTGHKAYAAAKKNLK